MSGLRAGIRAHLVLTEFLLCLLAPSLAAQATSSSAAPQWSVAPGLFPGGAQMAVVEGNPLVAGRFTALLAMPDGYRMPPHSHPADERVEVKEGTLLVGMGDKLDPRRTQALSAGDTATAPAGMHHFSVARGATVVAITMLGPYVMNYVHAADEPWHGFPYGY